MSKNYKLIFFAPRGCAQNVAQSLFKAGAGTIGNYDQCCFMTEGKGQFRPLEGSNPHLGSQDKLEFVDEYKVEMLCPHDRVTPVLSALYASHPYEEPAFDLIELVNVSKFGGQK